MEHNGANGARNNPHEFDATNVPAALTEYPHWTLWAGTWLENGKLNKQPKRLSGANGSSTDPTAWMPFGRAVAAAKKQNGTYGIGYVFAPEDPFGGIDLDHCIDPETGEIKEWAQEIIASAGTYAEISPSGTGVKLIGRFELPLMSRHKKVLNDETGEAIEVYTRGRFFTVTGRQISGLNEVRDIQLTVNSVIGKYFHRPTLSSVPRKAREVRPLTDKQQEAVIRAIAARLPESQLHDMALHLAGYLLRRTDQNTVEDVMIAAWADQGLIHADGSGLKQIIADTRNKLDAGEHVTGGPNIEERSPEMIRALEAVFPPRRASNASNDNKPEKRNQADRLIDYAKETGAELFVDHLGAPHALVDGEAVALNSRCYPWLRELLWEREQRSATREALGQAAGTLAAFALHSGVEHELHTRAAFHDGAVYYQLGKGRVVKIDGSGWRIASDPPVLFRSIANLKDLPDPVRGGSLAPLHDLVNLKDERDRRLFDTYMTLLPLADIPRPMLQPTGQQGSGKTTLSRIVKRTLDPSAPEAVRLDPREFLQKAAHAYIIMLDNQPNLPEWAADTLCRLVTGESDSKRQLYTDDEDVIVEMRRAVLINGINTPSDRGDVQERTLPLELDRIPKSQRRSERVMWAEFDKAHAGMLGAIFDALSATLRIHGTLTFGDLPRMADWAEYAIAAYEHFGWGARQFVEDWSEIEGRQNQGAIEGSAVAQTIIEIMKVHTRFEKPSSELLEALEAEAEKLKINIKRDKQWPGSPKWLWRRIKEVLPALGAYGISADNDEKRRPRTIVLTLDGGPDNNPVNKNASVDGSVDGSESAVQKGSSTPVNSDIISGQTYGSLSRTAEEEEEEEAEPEAGTGAPLQCPENDDGVDGDDGHNSITGDPNDPRNFSTLSEAQKDTLLAWIDKNIKPGAKRSLSSYDLKHYFEASEGGFYIDNGQFKGAMRRAGWDPMDLDGDGVNWYFCVSQEPTGPRRP